MILAMFVWSVMVISTCQLCLLIWLLRATYRALLQEAGHALHRKTHCIWCWQALHLQRWYPSCWSSCMCCYHYRVIRARRAARSTRVILPVKRAEARSRMANAQQEAVI
jgi:hypothetical protein